MSPLLCVLALLAAQGALAPQDEQRTPPPQRKLAGLYGLVAHWRLTPEGAEQADATLTASFAFPARARLQLRPDGARASDRRVVFRYGERLWALEPRVETSRPLAGEERGDALLEAELRRVTLLWPADLEWRPAEAAPETGLVATLGAAGRLVASVPAAGARPRALRALDGEGRERAALRDIVWGQGDGRTWPQGWTFAQPGLVRGERLERAAGGRYLEDHFLPPEHRIPGPRSRQQPVRRVAAGEQVGRRIPLAAQASLEAALEEADRRLAVEAEAFARRGLVLEAGPTLELDDEARPTALWLILEDPPAEPPPGWERRAPCAVVALLLPGGIGELRVGDLIQLREAAGGRTAGPPLLAIQPRDRVPRRAEVQWPLAH